MRLTITFALLLCSIFSYSQKCVVANIKENVVYIGIPNPLDIAVEGYKCKDITVTTDNGRLETTDNDCSYSLYPTDAGTTYIILIERKSEKQLGKLPFRVKHIPEPVAIVAGKQGGAITKSIMKVQIGIAAVLLGFDFDARFMVTGFTISIIRKSKSLYTEECSNARFTDNTKSAFNTLEDGDKIVFSNITCKGPDSRTRQLQPIEFIISIS
jgi:hypothetical protein